MFRIKTLSKFAILTSQFCVALALTGGLTSCGIMGTEQNSGSQDIAKSDSDGTRGQLIPIKSDNVSAAGYDGSTQVMTIQFKNGALYEYYGVPGELWSAFLAAQPNPWSIVGYPRLVRGGFSYTRIG